MSTLLVQFAAIAILLALLCAMLLRSNSSKFSTARTIDTDTDLDPNTDAENKSEKIIQQIDALLPQTQCGQCGYPGCRPYATAIASGVAINRCPPGGDRTIHALATLLHTDILPLDVDTPPPPRSVAFIRESECIGCTKCIQACPVDAIVGAAKLMHTVIAAECTGCDLCVEPCPVDCIDMLPLPQHLPQHLTKPATYTSLEKSHAEISA